MGGKFSMGGVSLSQQEGAFLSNGKEERKLKVVRNNTFRSISESFEGRGDKASQ